MIISVRVKPGSKHPGIDTGPDGILTVRVAARPVEGKANEAVVEALARHFGVPKSAIALVAGGKSKLKRFEIVGHSRAGGNP